MVLGHYPADEIDLAFQSAYGAQRMKHEIPLAVGGQECVEPPALHFHPYPLPNPALGGEEVHEGLLLPAGRILLGGTIHGLENPAPPFVVAHEETAGIEVQISKQIPLLQLCHHQAVTLVAEGLQRHLRIHHQGVGVEPVEPVV